MKKIVVVLGIIILLKRFSIIPINIMYVAIPMLLVLFLIRKAFSAAIGKTKNGRTGTMYDDYL